MKFARALVFLVLGACALAGCNSPPDDAEPAPTATVEVNAAATHPIEDAVVVYGSVEFVASRTRAMTVQVESQVAERFVLPGTPVKSGQALLRLVPSATSHLDVDKASRDASVAEAEAQRVGRLRGQGLATDSELRLARAASQSATQLRDSLNARIGANGLTLRAPIDGIVDLFTVEPGDVVGPGTVVMRIADPKAVSVRLGLEPDDVVRIQVGQEVTLAALNPGATIYSGHIIEVDARVDATTRVASAVAQPDAGARLVPGSSVRARVVVSVHSNSITVPRAAVLYSDERPFVFVSDGGKARRRPVTTGLSDAAQIEIVKGLVAGDSVITGGNYELEEGMAVKEAADQQKTGGAGEPGPARGPGAATGPAAGREPGAERNAGVAKKAAVAAVAGGDRRS